MFGIMSGGSKANGKIIRQRKPRSSAVIKAVGYPGQRAWSSFPWAALSCQALHNDNVHALLRQAPGRTSRCTCWRRRPGDGCPMRRQYQAVHQTHAKRHTWKNQSVHMPTPMPVVWLSQRDIPYRASPINLLGRSPSPYAKPNLERGFRICL